MMYGLTFSPLVENVTEPAKILKGLSESTSTEIAVLKRILGMTTGMAFRPYYTGLSPYGKCSVLKAACNR